MKLIESLPWVRSTAIRQNPRTSRREASILNFGHSYLFEICILVLGIFISQSFFTPSRFLLKLCGSLSYFDPIDITIQIVYKLMIKVLTFLIHDIKVDNI